MQRLNWDDLRVFLAVARTGRLVEAAKRQMMDQATVARRVNALEEALDVRLFDRSPRGVTLTVDGEQLRDHAERVETEILAAQEAIAVASGKVAGKVRLATPEALGIYVIAPAMARFVARRPGLELELMPESRFYSLSAREADIVVTLAPSPGTVATQKLADYHLGFYGSRSYLEQYGAPATTADLASRPVVSYIEDMIDLPELRYLDQVADHVNTVFRSTSLAAQQNAVAAGLGLGLLHSFGAAQDPSLVRVLPEVEIWRSYWVTVSLHDRAIPRVRLVVDFLRELVAAHPEHFRVTA